MTDLSVISAFLAARDGDFRPLADVIERGIPLDSTTRKFLASYLRGDIKRPRGNRRTHTARSNDAKALWLVKAFTEQEKLFEQEAKKVGIPYRAKGGMRAYLECHPDMKEDTLKGMLMP